MILTRSIWMLTVLAVMMFVPVSGYRAIAQDEAPPVDDEVMQPTKRGFRLTPEMARMICSMPFKHDRPMDEMGLTLEQESQLSEVMARRMMQLGHGYGEHLQPSIEYFIESMIAHQSTFPVDVAQRFGELAGPVIPGVRELLNGVREDSREILDADQFTKFDKDMQRAIHEIGRFENKMNRWAEGRANDQESLDHYESEDGEPPEGEDEKPKNPHMQRAEAMARWETNRSGLWEWRRFLNGVKYFFKFDEAQTAKAEKLLSDYRKRADEVMTDEWKKATRLNRIKYHLRHRLGDMKRGPWLYRLETEYEEALVPIKELGQAFRGDLLALVTDEQREAALAGVRERGLAHGLPEETLKALEAPLIELKQKHEEEPTSTNTGDN